MFSTIKEPKNIPVSISILHEQEYNNICTLFNLFKDNIKKRRAFSEKNNNKEYKEECKYESFYSKSFVEYRRQSLKY